MNAPFRFVIQRREMKFPLLNHQWDRVVSCAREYLPVERFDGAHDVSNVSSVYLDTPALDCYREYQEAQPIRTKVRVRRYGYEGAFERACWVEVKIKHNGNSLKRRFCSSADRLTDFMAGNDICDRLRDLNADCRELPRIYRVASNLVTRHALRPVVRVDYERMAFQQASSREVRITVDRNLTFYSTRPKRIVKLDGIILEVKYAGGRPPWFFDFLGALGITRSGRFSKYARAVEKVILNGEPEGGDV
ncbi:MAG: polyphosphate polymerase domain-containing protein [Phycisphaerales bacterium]|nr:polyphosphate polymerase domain-containing protein [Phycisphaerales bacterium]